MSALPPSPLVEMGSDSDASPLRSPSPLPPPPVSQPSKPRSGLELLVRVVRIVRTWIHVAWFNVGMCSSDSDPSIMTYVLSSLPSNRDLVYSANFKLIHRITESEWDSLVSQSKLLVMVMFFAEWCAPCLEMLSILDALNSHFTNRFKFYIVEIEEEVIIDRCYVDYLPTFIVFKGGEEMDRLVEPDDPRKIWELVDQYM
ncbi:thioredoxin M1, chloroplastic [Eutrema salsugineum]|uniref:thioredoxin M1, chloroplastic n=1 Tax=Eutrema salsugineum TaxID=72664 RepID=UPI000CED3297|nr:thioredoxin M1, chloroplastic [Eutrema salsugineum]